MYVLNTKMLNNEDIKEILNHQQKPVIIAHLIDISVFKSQNKIRKST